MSQETKEGFCTTCATGLRAITGMGISGSSKLGDPEKDKERKKLLYQLGILISLISLVYLIYLFCFSDCKECR